MAKETGWSEQFILEKLPLARLLAYEHCAFYKEGLWTVPRTEPADVEDLLGALGAYQFDAEAEE